MSKPTVAVLGASTDRNKYGNKAVRAYLDQGYEVHPINPSETEIEGLKTYSALDEVPVDMLDRISVYLPPTIGITLLEEIQDAGAEEVWLNPGSESPELLARAEELGLDVIQACSIVDIGAQPSAF
jgi:predicted CoA-binding protein